MESCSEESKCLASLAVFRELYDSQKDVYGIISEFLAEIISSKAKRQFGVTEITNLLNSTYDFNVPTAVVSTSLNRLGYLEKSKGVYTLREGHVLSKSDLQSKQVEIQKNNDFIIDRLVIFVEKVTKKKLAADEKVKLVHSFCSFILDDSNGKTYSEYISAFIIENMENKPFTSQLNTIKEGVILYSGIKFNSTLSNIGSWRNDLTVFLDTEILFHFAGYHGEVFKVLFEDFFRFVKDINHKNQKRTIQLKYFREVTDEIEGFFKKAEFIANGKDKANPKITAMTSIVEGCTSASDVVIKKSQFFQLLSNNGILEDDYIDYYNKTNHKYNLEDKKLMSNVANSTGIEDINEHIKFLNFINIRRKEHKCNDFDDIGYILLTGNSKTLQIAYNEEIRAYSKLPLAVTLTFITNKFWFKLNKGFGDNNYPKAFDVITKAQIVLSSQLNDSVGKRFDDFQKKLKRGELTEEQAVATIVDLRNQVKKPEEIHNYEVQSILHSITEGSIEQFIQEQEFFKAKANKEAEENTNLKSTIQLKTIELEEKELEFEHKQLINKLELKENLLLEKKQLKLVLNSYKVPIDKLAMSKYFRFKLYLTLTLLFYYIALVLMIKVFTWNEMEQITYMLGLMPLVASLVYLIIKEKNFDPIKFLEHKKRTCYEEIYVQFNIDTSGLLALEAQENELIIEIQELTNRIKPH